MPFVSGKQRDYQNQEKLAEIVKKYPEDKYPKLPYAQMLRDMGLDRNETSSLIYNLDKFGLNRNPDKRKVYKNDEERRLAKQQSTLKYLNSKEDETTILLSNFPIEAKELIIQLKNKESFTDFFLNCAAEKYPDQFKKYIELKEQRVQNWSELK